jgi:hypothetical protein
MPLNNQETDKYSQKLRIQLRIERKSCISFVIMLMPSELEAYIYLHPKPPARHWYEERLVDFARR